METAKSYYEESVSVYITDTGDCYHKYECEHIQSKTAARLENVFMDYRPCSFCNPPVVEWDPEKMCFFSKEIWYSSENGPTFSKTLYFPADNHPIIISTAELDDLYTASTQAQSSSRVDEIRKEMEEVKNDPLFRDAELRASNAENAKDRLLQLKKDAEEQAAISQEKLEKLEKKVRVSGILAFLVGIPCMVLGLRLEKMHWEKEYRKKHKANDSEEWGPSV